jgi:hypothetical protein
MIHSIITPKTDWFKLIPKLRVDDIISYAQTINGADLKKILLNYRIHIQPCSIPDGTKYFGAYKIIRID